MNLRRFVTALLSLTLLAGGVSVGSAASASNLFASPENQQNRLGQPFAKDRSPAGECALPRTNRQSKDRTPSRGVVNYLVLFADFDNLPASRPTSEIASYISPQSERDFFVESSGQFTLKYTFIQRWLRMPRPSGDYSFKTYDSHRAYVEAAVKIVDREVDFRKFDGVLVLTDPSDEAFPNGPAIAVPAGFGIFIDGIELKNAATSGADLAYWGSRWANHEIGHNLGLPDLYSYLDPRQHIYVGEFSYMGLINGQAPGLFAYEKWLLNWITKKQIICKPVSGNTYSLTSLGTRTGKKLLLIPINKGRNLAVEYRTADGLDKELGNPGLVVYVINSTLKSGNGVIQVLNDSGEEHSPDNSMLRIGDSTVQFGYSIKLVSTSGSKARVLITKK